MSEFKLKEGVFLAVFTLLFGTTFLLYHLGLDQYYCLSADDFAGIDNSIHGIPGLSHAWHFYWNWEGPFLSHFINGLILWTVSFGAAPMIVFMLVKLALLGSTALLIRSVFIRFQCSLSWSKSWLVAITFNIILYLISPNKSEIWHWLTGTLYLVPLICLQLGAAAIMRDKLLLSVVPFAVVMQSKVTYAVLVFGFLVLLTALTWILNSDNRKRALFCLTALFLFLAAYIVAPGNYVRLTDHGKSNEELLWQFIIGLYNLFISFNLAKLDRVILGLLIGIPILGTKTKLLRPSKFWYWLVPVFLYLGFSVMHEVLFVSITGCREWTRVLSLHSYLFLVMVFVYGVWLFGLIPEKWQLKIWPASVIGVVGMCLHLFNGHHVQLQMGEELKSNYDSRMATIMKHEEIGDTLYVEPMNYEGVLYFQDFSEDPGNWINKDFTKAHEIDFEIALKAGVCQLE
ncbi:MAG: hypothetical protein K9J17_02055 [Flavobacteriales bacterium]|nr:hypothetical protein [Flavobacteriales bacterium]